MVKKLAAKADVMIESFRTGTMEKMGLGYEDVKAENPFASLKTRELRQAVADCIGNLPEKERLVVSLYYYEDLNMKEIGNVLGITESRFTPRRSGACARSCAPFCRARSDLLSGRYCVANDANGKKT